eukprot:CAMPEP_0170592984 /NCGR_PEP_ID=MMETSP0224-20130122/13206_1 /TAXON_ID=285029 /ORGANISM="Togula jolla, Strain CCCM 725" /LENGTH=595 /DNA_ID=CAMNT_0010916907 /DNA_START=65 /DNA_END=1852 /DNA_ORIENTATION=-
MIPAIVFALLLCITSSAPASHMTQEMLDHQARTGAPWSKGEVLTVMAKLYAVFENPLTIFKTLTSDEPYECRTGFNDPPDEPCDGQDGREDGNVGNDWLPTAAKFLRLGFHDCLKYKDVSGGCDGCLEFTNMFIRYNDKASGDKRNRARLDALAGDNNNLAFAADVLEKIYTTPSFPAIATPLKSSLQKTGKSRADLWALATLASTHYTMHQNNLACQGNGDDETGGRCGHIYHHDNPGHPCEIDMAFSMEFLTGRRDCPARDKPTDPRWYRSRPYETTRKEAGPNPHGNGKATANFFRDWFGMSRRETVAILGAHSLGSLHGVTNLFKYDWKRAQTHLLNNQYYRILAQKPSLMAACGDAPTHPKFTGGPSGSLAPTGWFVRPIRKCVSGGPFEWFHYYRRCPECLGNTNIETEGDGTFRSDYCCKQCATKKAADVDPKCFTKVTKDETAIPVDTGLYFDFQTGEGGIPLGCPGFGAGKFEWSVAAINSGDGRLVDYYTTEPKCDLQHLNDGPGSLEMHEVVELYANDQKAWVDDFIPALQKMLGNGYSDGELSLSFDLKGVACKRVGKYFCTHTDLAAVEVTELGEVLEEEEV